MHKSRLHTFAKANPHFSDQELEMFEQIVSAPREDVEPEQVEAVEPVEDQAKPGV